jgi:hypothetical protein
MSHQLTDQPVVDFYEEEKMRHPPYHLRTNKAVDRLLLVEVLRALGPDHGEFTYYSLAGPFLEDLKVMDHFFPDMKLVSLESNEQTYQRQKFHQFNSRVELQNKTLADFLTHDYESGVRDVFWLDHTDLTYPRFTQFQDVLKKVPVGSVVRITLRAEPEIDLESLKERLTNEEIERLQEKSEKAFRDEFDKVWPHSTLSGHFLSDKPFARMVQLMVRRAASEALEIAGNKVEYLPIQSTRYNDNTQMLSVTGIVCLRGHKIETCEQLKAVRFADFEWAKEPTLINIPALSVKERLHLEHLLPVAENKDVGEELLQALGYMIDNGRKTSKQQLSHYADYHRDYPNFVRISI